MKVTGTDSHYYPPGNYKKETGSVNRELHYISAATGVVAVFEKTASTQKMYYLHKDHLGSVNVITKDDGTVQEEMSFDACLPTAALAKVGGRQHNPANWTYTGLAATHLIDRGYTGHEHLDAFGLINMPACRSNGEGRPACRSFSEGRNGRMYDPLLGRFLSPDKFVQAPGNTQSYNRYSYCMNNPLKYTDPSGWASVASSYLTINTMSGGGEAFGDIGADGYTNVGWMYSSSPAYSNPSYQAVTNNLFEHYAIMARIEEDLNSRVIYDLKGNPHTITSDDIAGQFEYHWTGKGTVTIDKETGFAYSDWIKIKEWWEFKPAKSGGGGWLSDAWNSTIVRGIIPDYVHVGVGFVGIAGCGAGTSFELNWVLRGPQASIKPLITTTVTVGGGYQIDATLNIGGSRYLGPVSEIRRDFLQTSISDGQAGIFGSGGVSALGKIGLTGTWTPTATGYGLFQTEVNIGVGLTPGPNGAGGASNTFILRDFY